MNEYDDLLKKPAEAPAGNEFDDLLRERSQDSGVTIRRAAAAGAQTPPEKMAEVIKLSERTKLPTDVVERNFDVVSRESKVSANDYDEIMRKNPVVAQWLTDPANASLSHDDIPFLRRVENTFGGFAQGWRKARTQAELGDLLYSEMIEGALPERGQRIKELKDTQNRLASEESVHGIPEYITSQTGYSFRQLLSSTFAAVEGSAYGGVGGGMIGMALPGVGTVIGTAAGMKAGALVGLANYSYKMESAFAFDELRSLRDMEGKPLDPVTARNVAMGVGAVNGVIETGSAALLSTLVPGMKGIIGGLGADQAKRAVIERTKQALAAPTTRAIVIGALGKLTAGSAVEGIEEFAQALVNAAGREVAQAASGQDFAPDDVTKDVADASRQALDAFVGSFFSLAPAFGAGAYVQNRRALTARQGAELFTALGEGVAESKTYKLLPERMQQFVDQATKDGPVEKVYIPIEQWVTYWQNKDTDPAVAAAEVMGETALYESALRTGEDLAIPTGRYAARIAATEHGKFFNSELRLGPDEMSAREAEEFEKQIEQTQERQKEREQDKKLVELEAGLDKIAGDVSSKLVAAGVEQGNADAYAATYRAAFRSIAERAGVDPVTLFEKYGLQITREGMAKDGEQQMAQPIDPQKVVEAAIAKAGDQKFMDVSQRHMLDARAQAVHEGKQYGEQERQLAMIRAAHEILGPSEYFQAATGPTINVDGQDRPTTNSNGQPIAQTREALVSFWRWFGDSKVVDEQGRPLVVYHGTKADINGAIEGREVAGWFAEDPETSERYARNIDETDQANILPVYLSIKRPLTAAFDTDEQINAAEAYEIVGATPPDYLNGMYDAHEIVNHGAFVLAAKKAGYDGIKINERSKVTWAIFEPKQVKSAIGNRGTFDPESGNILYQITPDQARTIEMDTKLPTDPLFEQAVANTPGANVEIDGLLIDVVRFQKPEQSGEESVRTGVFYLPASSKNVKHYKGKASVGGYGGTERVGGPTLLRAPLFVKGATGGKAPENAYDAIKGKGAYQKMRNEVLQAGGVMSVGRYLDPSEQADRIGKTLEEHGADPGIAYDLMRHSREGNRLAYAMQENIVAHAVRAAGYDSVVGYSVERKSGKPFISEIFDVRETTYPIQGEDGSLHDVYTVKSAIGNRGTFDPESGNILHQDKLDLDRLDALFPKAGESVDGRIVRKHIPNTSSIEASFTSHKTLPGVREVPISAFDKKYIDGVLSRPLDERTQRLLDEITESGELNPLIVGIDADGPYIVEGGHRFDAMIKAGAKSIPALIAVDGRVLEQDTGEKRGRIRFGKERKFSIDLLAGADLSTFLHESGHFWLEVLGDIHSELRLVEEGKLTPQQKQMRDDFTTLLGWLGVKDRTEIGEAQHEQFARGIEAYMMEGRSPNAEMRSIFARFRAWLTAIYRSIRALNVELTPEVRAVMDRVFATDREIEAAKSEAMVAPLFATAKDAGMTEREFDAYRSKVQQASDRARDELQAKLLRTLQREREAWWKKEREGVRVEVEAEVSARQEYRTLTVLQSGALPDGSEPVTGKVKLDRGEITDQRGEEFVRALPRGTTARDGIPLSTAAELFGYDSPDALLKALTGLRPMKQAIEVETDERMRARHGDVLVDGKLAEEAQAAVQNEGRAEVLLAELRALAKLQRAAAPAVAAERAEQAEKRKAGLRSLDTLVPSLQSIRNAAANRIAGTKVRDLTPGKFLVAARRASMKAVEAAAGGDITTAVAMKRRELFNVELYRMANAAREEADATVDYMQKFAQAKVRARITKAGQDYLDQIDGFLDRYEFVRLPLKTLEKRKALTQWVAEKERAGEPVDIGVKEQAEERTNFKDMLVEELRGVRDAVKNIEHLAKLKNRLLTAKKNRDLQAVVDEMVSSIEENATTSGKNKIESRLPKDEIARSVDSWFGSHRKLDSLMREMDGMKDGGAMWEYIVRPLNAAADREAAMNRQAIKKLVGLFNAAYKGREVSKLYDKIEIAPINDSLSKMARIMIALNIGNADNYAKIKDGYGWNDSQVQAVVDTLDARDWKFVQEVWDFVDSFWPEIKAKEERVAGVAPQKVDAQVVKTSFGELRGGYFPIRYDDRQSPRAKGDLVAETAAQMKNAGYGRSTTRRGHTKERVEGVKRQIRTDFGVIFEHVTQVIHDLSHHEALVDVNRLLQNKAVQKAILDHYGDITYDLIQDTITDVAAGVLPAQTRFEKAMNWLRSGVTVAGLAWNVTTSLLQFTGLAQSTARLGPKWIGVGMSRWMRDAAGMENSARWIREKSEFMRSRDTTQMREINEIRNHVGLNTGKVSGWIDEALRTVSADVVTRQGIVDSYFWLIYKGQQVADIPTWIGAYEKALSEGNDDARAVALADQAVRDTQGSGNIKDLAEIQRGGPLLKLWTNFYSYFNVTYNLTAESVKRTKFTNPISVGRLAVDFVLLYTVPATAAFLLKQGLQAMIGGGEDEEKFWTRLLMENLSYLAGVMVGMREFSSVLAGFSNYQGPAGTRFFSETAKLIKQTAQGEADGAFFRALNQSAGILFHYPAGQVQRTVDGYVALREGQTKNPLTLLVGAPKQ